MPSPAGINAEEDHTALGVEPTDVVGATVKLEETDPTTDHHHHSHHEVHHHEVHHHHELHHDVENHTTELQPGTVKDPLAESQTIDHGVGGEGVVAGSDPEQAALDAGEEAAAAAMEAAAAAEAAEACLGNVLDDVGVDVHHHHQLHQPNPVEHAPQDEDAHHAAAVAAAANMAGATAHEDDEVALAAAAAAAAVQAADGMAVVVDQALLATAAAAAASQVAEVLAEQQPGGVDVLGPPPLAHVPDGGDGSPSNPGEHVDLLEQRRQKDRKRYSAMTPEARASYNAHRRALYHKQGESARKRRRERERDRYHSLEGDAKKSRNERRAKLERDRYNRLSKGELASRNAKRRERAKQRKTQAKQTAAAHLAAQQLGGEDVPLSTMTIPPPKVPGGLHKSEAGHEGGEEGGATLPNLPDMVGDALPEATVDVADAHAMADASALAAEVAEQVIAGTNLDTAMDAVNGAGGVATAHDVMEEEEGPTVQI